MKVDSRTDRGVYCKRTATPISHMKGFTTSGKIKEAIKWFSTVPHNEKAIIYSFFKGSLDLIEGVISYDLGLECARYDGDINKEDREAELDKFKTTRSCRVLLATVQSGGTGLNITEANVSNDMGDLLSKKTNVFEKLSLLTSRIFIDTSFFRSMYAF